MCLYCRVGTKILSGDIISTIVGWNLVFGVPLLAIAIALILMWRFGKRPDISWRKGTVLSACTFIVGYLIGAFAISISDHVYNSHTIPNYSGSPVVVVQVLTTDSLLVTSLPYVAICILTFTAMLKWRRAFYLPLVACAISGAFLAGVIYAFNVPPIIL